jgi:hypothetical protein
MRLEYVLKNKIINLSSIVNLKEKRIFALTSYNLHLNFDLETWNDHYP